MSSGSKASRPDPVTAATRCAPGTAKRSRCPAWRARSHEGDHHQPEHLPWLGLLAKVAASDMWIVLDSVPYRKNYFQNRNRVLLNGRSTWLTVPVTAPFGTRIHDVRIYEQPSWRRRYCGRLIQAVSGTRGADRVDDLVSLIDSAPPGGSLADLNLDIADWLLAQFDVKVPTVRSSELAAPGTKSELLVGLCRAVGAGEYLAGPRDATTWTSMSSPSTGSRYGSSTSTTRRTPRAATSSHHVSRPSMPGRGSPRRNCRPCCPATDSVPHDRCGCSPG
ncbi:hypothetical protein E4K10_22260 [Streptomyces sp. T1317-0309]|nr:hypothetical protein E4K10_22260 [Streptomyces sp. T1317-0309]